MKVSQKRLDEAHAKALKLADEIESLQLELHAQKDILALAGSGKHKTNSGTFQVSENNVYDEEVIMNSLSKGQFMRCSERKLRKGLVKVLYPNVYEAAKERRGYKISL
jgi:hypothetical protein